MENYHPVIKRGWLGKPRGLNGDLYIGKSCVNGGFPASHRDIDYGIIIHITIWLFNIAMENHHS